MRKWGRDAPRHRPNLAEAGRICVCGGRVVQDAQLKNSDYDGWGPGCEVYGHSTFAFQELRNAQEFHLEDWGEPEEAFKSEEAFQEFLDEHLTCFAYFSRHEPDRTDPGRCTCGGLVIDWGPIDDSDPQYGCEILFQPTAPFQTREA